MNLIRNTILLALCALCVPLSRADEGMWLFNNPPTKILQDKYHFQPTAAWLDHLQKASVRFNSGGAGSFVSAGGVGMTKHHVGAGCLAEINTQGKDYIKTGLEARNRAPRAQRLAVETKRI